MIRDHRAGHQRRKKRSNLPKTGASSMIASPATITEP